MQALEAVRAIGGASIAGAPTQELDLSSTISATELSSYSIVIDNLDGTVAPIEESRSTVASLEEIKSPSLDFSAGGTTSPDQATAPSPSVLVGKGRQRPLTAERQKSNGKDAVRISIF